MLFVFFSTTILFNYFLNYLFPTWGDGIAFFGWYLFCWLVKLFFAPPWYVVSEYWKRKLTTWDSSKSLSEEKWEKGDRWKTWKTWWEGSTSFDSAEKAIIEIPFYSWRHLSLSWYSLFAFRIHMQHENSCKWRQLNAGQILECIEKLLLILWKLCFGAVRKRCHAKK